jgi:hypothetical protein
MQQHNTLISQRSWYESGHASLCLLGMHLRRIGFFKPLEAQVKIRQKNTQIQPGAKTGDVAGGSAGGSQSGEPHGYHGAH